ncbi:hypothetical protein HMH01_13040 [Halovulum dunhuangense]|uniref:Uncharacterized protein n=1 Tax=Halovulum dunhuangense TaxID=1505036 RepID=A0A849L526_9RHOB|nr:hypothetical protein [Halovulum dunhuangense]NNU81363.1 hypothetical protein [Halovulum dunhuangense]
MIEKKFGARIIAHLNALRIEGSRANERKADMVVKLRENARRSVELAKAAGYKLDARQAAAFEAVHVAMMSGMKLDAALMRRANDVYGQVVRDLRAENFLPENHGPNAYDEAVEKVRFLFDADGFRKDADRSDLLATFVALAQTEDSLRDVLTDMPAPEVVSLERENVDGVVRSLLNSLVQLITHFSFSPKRRAASARQELDALSDALSEIQGERRFIASTKILAGVEQANEFLADQLKSGSEKLAGKASQRRERAQRAGRRRQEGAWGIAQMVAGLGSREATEGAGDWLTTGLNKQEGWNSLMAAVRDLRGMTASNRDLLRMINPVKAQIDAMRQRFREDVPAELAKRFSRELSSEEWSEMYQAIAKADLLAIGRRRAMDLMKDPSKLDQEISTAEEKVSKLGGKFANRYQEKAKALARFMVQGEIISENLLRNAHAIAHLYGEEKGLKPDQATIKAIDELTSLYAYELLEEGTRSMMSELASQEEAGMAAVAGMVFETRASETKRRDRHGMVNEVAQNNGWKGYIPSVVTEGAEVIVADDRDYDDLVRRGYERIGDFKGDRNEGYRGKRGYYQTSVGGKNAFRQGIAQTVHETWQGVDARTGQSQTRNTGGMIEQAQAEAVADAVRKAGSRIKNALPPAGNGDRLVVDGGQFALPRRRLITSGIACMDLRFRGLTGL